MVRIQQTPRFPTGTRVSKYFNGYANPFGGTVDSFAPKTGFYHISYDDGDSEEMTEDDVEVHFHYLPQNKTGAAMQPIPPPPTRKKQAAKRRKMDARPRRMHSPPPPDAPSPDNEEEEEEEGEFAMVLSLNDNAPPTARDSRLDLSPLHVDIPKDPDAGDEPMLGNEEEEEDGGAEEETVGAEEINQLIGKPVIRQFPKSDGSGVESLRGTVSIFFPATKMFRVLYGNSVCEDLSYKEVIGSIPLYSSRVAPAKKRKASADSAQNAAVQTAPTASPKRPKTLGSVEKPAFPNGESNREEKKRAAQSKATTSSSPRSPIREELTEFTVETGLDVVRKVLFLLVSTPSITHELKPKQLKVLGSMDSEPKKALKRFIKADGVSSLSELLKLWSNSNEAESGVLVTLKVLAVLPGITREIIKTSKIGVRVAYLHKKCTFENDHISELARWIVEKWRAQVDAEKPPEKTEDSPRAPSPRVDSPKEQPEPEEMSERRPSQSSDTNHETSSKSGSHKERTEPATSKRKENSSREKKNGKEPAKNSDNSSAKSAKLKDPLAVRQSKSVGHLKALLSGGNLRGKDPLRSAAVNSAKKRLGNPINWRARRSTVVLENVSKRVNEQASEREQQERKRREEELALARRRINFGDQDILLFDKEVEPTRLFTWFSSNARLLARRSTPPPNRPLDYKPKSILKSRSAYPDVVVEEDASGAVASTASTTAATATESTSADDEQGSSRPSLSLTSSAAAGDKESVNQQQTAQLSIHPPAHVRPISEAMSPTDGRRKTEEPRRCRSPPPPTPEDEDERASAEEGEVASDDVEMSEPKENVTEAATDVSADVNDREVIDVDRNGGSDVSEVANKEAMMVDAAAEAVDKLRYPEISLSIDADALAAAAAAGANHAASMENDPVTIEVDPVDDSVTPSVTQPMGAALRSLGEAAAAAITGEHARAPPSLST